MPIIWISISFFAGILSADLLNPDRRLWYLAGLAGSLVLFVLLYIKGSRIDRLPLPGKQFLFSLWLAFCLGGIRYSWSLPDFADPEYITNFADSGSSVVLTGVVDDFPDRRDQITNLRIKCEAIQFGADEIPQPVKGKLLAKIPSEHQVIFGDQVRLMGTLTFPPDEEGFSYREYLKRKGIYVYFPRAEIEVLERKGGNKFLGAIYGLKTRALQVLYQLWPDPEASLLAGILLGVESGIPDQVQKAFRETGTTHIIAISGFNITIVAGLFSRLFGRLLDPRRGALAAGLGIGVYTILVGADAAVLRAAVMGGLSLFAQQIGRRQHGINAAALASLIMAVFNPHLPWDISFQLSLSATLGLILYADLFAARFFDFSSRFLPRDTARRLTQPVSEYFLFTFAAQLTTFPVMLFHFQAFSISTFLANPAILPVQPPIMVVGGLALILGLCWFPLGQVAAPLVYPFVLYTIRVVEWFDTLPIRSLHIGQIGVGWIALIYLTMAIISFGWPVIYSYSSTLKPSLAVGGLALAAVLIWRGFFSAPDGYLHVYLFNVGTGTGMYIQNPSGRNLLVNGGPSTKTLSDHLGRLLPPFQRNLDYLIISSPQEQDLDSVAEILPRFRPREVIWLGSGSLSWEAQHLRQTLEDHGIPLTGGEPGQILEIGDGVRLKILAESERGGTLLLEYGHFRLLLPFGINQEDRIDFRMGRDLGEMTALLLADNGYQSSNPSEWIKNLNPQFLLLSVGIADSRGLPDQGLIDRLAGYSLLRTDQHGMIQITTDGKLCWIEVEKLD